MVITELRDSGNLCKGCYECKEYELVKASLSINGEFIIRIQGISVKAGWK